MITATVGFARALESGTTLLAHQLRDAVVEVRSDRTGNGSGIVWGGAGLVITNAHCVARGGALEIRQGARRHRASLIAHHSRHDLALLASPGVRGPLLAIRDPDSLDPGELVFAQGHPLGVRDALALGVLHSVAREQRTGRPRWIVSDVRLAPGNSGGPLVDVAGRLVGINSMIADGLGVAVPADLAAHFVDLALAERAA